MKKWLFGTMLGASLLLAACGGDEAATESDTAKTETEQATETAETEDHRIIAGTVVIANILDRLELDAVAIPDTIKELPTRFDGLPNIGNAMDPDPEIIKSLNPTELLTVSITSSLALSSVIVVSGTMFSVITCLTRHIEHSLVFVTPSLPVVNSPNE